MPFCSQCGTKHDINANFCSNCGFALTGLPPSHQTVVDDDAEIIQPRIKTRVPDFVEEALHPSESLFGAFKASLWDHHKEGVSLAHDKFVLTDQRIILYHTGLFHKGMGEMPYKAITEVSYSKGIFHGKVVIEAANAGLTMDGIGNDDAAFAEKIIAGGVAGRRFRLSDPEQE